MRVFHVIMLLSVFFTSCNTYYGLGNFSSEAIVLQKPTIEKEKEYYLNGSWFASNNSDQNGFNQITISSFNFHKGITKSDHNIAFGGFIHSGKVKFGESNFSNFIDFRNDEDPFSNSSVFSRELSFYGGGITGEYSYNIELANNLEFRAIGTKATFTYEKGNYRNFRKTVNNGSIDTGFFLGDVVDLAPNDFSLSLGLFSDLLYKFPHSELGFNVLMGYGNHKVIASAGLYYSISVFNIKINTTTSSRISNMNVLSVGLQF